MTESSAPTRAAKTNPLIHVVHVIVGALIGLAEMVPGVSGGTVALVTGIYERAIKNGDALLHALRCLFGNRAEFKQAIQRIEWVFLITIGFGMIATVLSLSKVMHSFVEDSPHTARALFLGMVAVSLIVPLRMIDKADFAAKKIPAIALFILAAVSIFILTGFTSAEKQNPSLIIIFFAAAIAVCALVLPGVSGSFMLLAMGLYQPVIGAVGDRDLSIIAVFALGAVCGLAFFIKTLKFLITEHHTLTMATMAGFMLGSLRALWPWQTDTAQLLAPEGNVGWLVFMMVLGGVIAGGIMVLERFTESEPQTV
ncbi:DUF368 domain-containing protein [Corynebacterium felinum]|uniref:Membrane protein n=1 Tax=Corynebacterium felinum TaxID=131318 RepID=A0ABU2BAT7_9CORY|nr:DUF368 domain-containing protein [Corynebacterium felinum]MDF5820439.1 DUF368 domain-containing protein [Corynebacterium felinum]MDR7355476.1 putative membrane protein [Corynebacterium felinum]WJY94827.1 hypothetical protein CFELI_06025 [Corynebacterium felinum]